MGYFLTWIERVCVCVCVRACVCSSVFVVLALRPYRPVHCGLLGVHGNERGCPSPGFHLLLPLSTKTTWPGDAPDHPPWWMLTPSCILSLIILLQPWRPNTTILHTLPRHLISASLSNTLRESFWDGQRDSRRRAVRGRTWSPCWKTPFDVKRSAHSFTYCLGRFFGMFYSLWPFS